MYLQSIKVRPKDKEIEFSYPKMISKDKIEFMAMKIDGASKSNYYVSDSENRISLKKSIFSANNRKFKIKPIAQQVKGKNNQLAYVFYIEVYEIIDTKEKLLTRVQCSLSDKELHIINNVFSKAKKEIKSKIECVEKIEVCFWNSEYKSEDIDLFNQISICFSPEVNEFNSKECWERNTYLDTLYLENMLEYIISQKYGFKNLFKSIELNEVVKQSNYRFNIKDILNHMNKVNKDICKFSLGSIVVQK